MVALLLLLGFSVSMALANDPYPITMRDQTPTEPLAAPDPSSFQPRYISGFGSGEAFTVFFEDRDNGSAISYAATTSGPAGLSSPPTATNIADTHFVVKDWPINVGETDYAYRAWASVGNNADHRFYVSNDLVNWTTVSTFTITNAATFTGAKGSVYYGFHDVIELNGTYYAFAESNQSQTMLVRSDNGDDVWEAFDSVGGTSGDGPLELPSGVTSGWTPSGSFFELKDDAGYGKIHVDPHDSAFYLAINTAATPSLSPADLETAFIDPDNWSWHDGTTGPAASPILAETAEHDLREAWLVPDASSPLTLIYDADFGSGDGGKALGYAIVGGIPDVVYVDDDWTDQTDVDAYDSSLTWQYDAFAVIQDGVDAVADGGTVHVLAGTYPEKLTIGKSLLLEGEDGSYPLINPVLTGSSRDSIISPEADNITIRGFEIANGDESVITDSVERHGIWKRDEFGLGPSGLTVEDCVIHHIQHGVRSYGDDLTVRGCEMHHLKYSGVAASGPTSGEGGSDQPLSMTITNNWFHDWADYSSEGKGVEIKYGNRVGEVSYNFISGMRMCIGYYNGGPQTGYGQLEIKHNTLDLDYDLLGGPVSTTMGISLWGTGSNGDQVIIRDNIFANAKWYGIYQEGATISGSIIVDNNFFHNNYWYYWPNYQYPYQWFGTDTRAQVGWYDGPADGFAFTNNIAAQNPHFWLAEPGAEGQWALQEGSPAINSASDGTNIGAYQGKPIPMEVWVDDDWTDQTDVDAYDSSLTWEYNAFQVVQDGLDGVATGGTVHVLAGTYNENILIKRRVAIRGAGSDPNGAVITQTQAGAGDSKVGVVQIAASGLSDAEPLLLQNLRIETDHLAGISVGRFTESTEEDIAYVKLNNVKVIGTNTNPNSEQERGLYVDTTSSLRHLVVEDSAFNNLTYGWYLQKEVSTDVSTVRYVTVTNTTFSHNNLKGLYAEKLSDASFTNCTVDGNGFSSDGVPSYFLPWMAGIDINLKAGIYENLIFTNCTVTNNALGGAANGVGLTAKARDDGGSYGPYPATLDGVTINGGTYSGNKAGIRLGEPGKANAGPTGAQVRDATLADNLDYGFNSQTQAAVSVVGNTFENHTKVFSQATGSLMAYANNVMTFTTGIISNTGATVNAMHNWWGAIDPTGVGDTDAYDFRLGAPVASYTDGTGSVTLADTTAGGDASLSGAGTLVIVNHGNGLTNVPFAKGIDPDANNSCADFHDFFAIDGSGTYTVSIPISITCQSNTDITTNNPRIYQFLLDAAGAPDPGCTPDTACWKAITATYNSGALTANVDVSELLGTPFAAPSNNNTDPTALILSNLSIRAALLLPAIGLLIVTVTLIIAIAPVRSSDLGLCRWFQ